MRDPRLVDISALGPDFWDEVRLIVAKRAHAMRNGSDAPLPMRLRSVKALVAHEQKQQRKQQHTRPSRAQQRA